jgi:hypothetical protein
MFRFAKAHSPQCLCGLFRLFRFQRTGRGRKPLQTPFGCIPSPPRWVSAPVGSADQTDGPSVRVGAGSAQRRHSKGLAFTPQNPNHFGAQPIFLTFRPQPLQLPKQPNQQ